ncbi:MAG: 2-oxoacid:acceptor oxidoreductase family protein [Deltaproteobacteria bacterium]|nr:2-oxoacid:acceptor oxidoreductase family protein [Deltaproteobacteria bacterium]
MEKCRIIFSGSGGQGIITSAIILAEAATLHEGLNAVQSQAYGPEARGGSSRSDVIISDKEIRYPKVIEPNILVCLTQAAYNEFASLIRPGGILLTDKFFVKHEKKVDARLVELDMHREVLKEIGRPIVFNICMLGAFIAITKLVKESSIMKVLEKRIPHGFLDMNKNALELGINMAPDLEL